MVCRAWISGCGHTVFSQNAVDNSREWVERRILGEIQRLTRAWEIVELATLHGVLNHVLVIGVFFQNNVGLPPLHRLKPVPRFALRHQPCNSRIYIPGLRHQAVVLLAYSLIPRTILLY